MERIFKITSIILIGAVLFVATTGCELLGGDDDTPAYLKNSYVALYNNDSGAEVTDYYIGDSSANDWTDELLSTMFYVSSLQYDELALIGFEEQLPTFDIRLDYYINNSGSTGTEYLYDFDVPIGKILIVEFKNDPNSNVYLDDASNWEDQIKSILNMRSVQRNPESGILKDLSGAGIGSL